jgi:hypothetical protein
MAKTTDKPRLVLNEDTMTLVNLNGYLVINKQFGPIENGLNGYRVTAHFQNSIAVLAAYSEEEHATECLKALIHYILTGKDLESEGDKDVFKVRSVIKESSIIIAGANDVPGGLTKVKK